MTTSRRNMSLETLALFRVAIIARPQVAVEIPLAEPIFVLNNAVLSQWGLSAGAQPFQAILVRNPDAWRFKILAGLPAEKEGIASYDWLLDSDLVLQWAGLQLNLQILEPDQGSSRPDDRSGLFQMAANLAAGNLQLEQDKGQLQQESKRHADQRRGLARAFRKRLRALKKKNRKIRAKERLLKRGQNAIDETTAENRNKENQLRLREEALDKAIDRMVSLRARAVTRWRTHIEKTLGFLEQKRAAMHELERQNLEIQAQLGPMVGRLAEEQNRINQADRRLTAERADMRAGMDSWRREELARQGQWLQRQAELTQKENQIRAEAGLLLKLRAAVGAQLSKPHGGAKAPGAGSSQNPSAAPAEAPIEWEPILKQALDREAEIAERQATLDSWTKRLELWAGALGERELLCANRERELASIATEYHDLRLRREEELASQAMELYQREVAYFEKRNAPDREVKPAEDEVKPTEDEVNREPLTVVVQPKRKRRPPNRPSGRPAASRKAERIDLTLGPRAVALARREADLVQREADLARLKGETEARSRKLAEEAIVLERYRSRLMGESQDAAAGKKEIKMLVEQWRKRVANQRQSLGSLRDYLLRLGKKLKKWSNGLALREANIVETELRLLEQRTRETVNEQVAGPVLTSESRAA